MRIGLAGTGRIGAFHAATILGLPDAPELVVTDAVPEVAASLAEQLGAEHAPTLDDLFASGVDGFVITTGTHDSVLTGADSSASTQAVLDVLASVRTGSPVR